MDPDTNPDPGDGTTKDEDLIRGAQVYFAGLFNGGKDPYTSGQDVGASNGLLTDAHAPDTSDVGMENLPNGVGVAKNAIKAVADALPKLPTASDIPWYLWILGGLVVLVAIGYAANGIGNATAAVKG